LPTGESAFSFVGINRRQIVHVIESVVGPHKALGRHVSGTLHEQQGS
jgi:hypothetical protein